MIVNKADWELSNGVNIEGLARQRDVNKLAKRIEELEKIVTVNEVHIEFGYTVRSKYPFHKLTTRHADILNKFAYDQYLLGTDVKVVEEELGKLADSLSDELNDAAWIRACQELNEEHLIRMRNAARDVVE